MDVPENSLSLKGVAPNSENLAAENGQAEKSAVLKRCPQCSEMLVFPRGATSYCEECGWPDEFLDEVRLWLEDAKNWVCECGAVGAGAAADWRWNGNAWEHHHGYPIGHVAATRLGNAPELLLRLLKGIEGWAADEDGSVHPDCWEAYREAKAFVGQFDWKEEA